ncbi:MAG: Flp family type IVb pilin [Pseudomonadota bacterium]
MERIRKLLRDEDGASAAEYCLLASFIACAIIAALRFLGITLAGIFTRMTGLLA